MIAQDHTAKKWQGWDLNPGLILKPCLLTLAVRTQLLPPPGAVLQSHDASGPVPLSLLLSGLNSSAFFIHSSHARGRSRAGKEPHLTSQDMGSSSSTYWLCGLEPGTSPL